MFEFAIRDDDLCYFTDPAELREAYDALPVAVPVSFAVVPFQGCTEMPSVPSNRRSGDAEFPVGDNEAVVDYLRDALADGSAAVMQHGYNHVYYEDGPEFVAGDDLDDRLRRGRDHLEATFHTEVDTFVPPSNQLSVAGLRAVKDAGMRTLYYPTPVGRPKTFEVVGLTVRDLLFKYRHKETGPLGFLRDADRFWRREDRSVFMPVMPWTYELGGVPEFSCVSMSRQTRGEPVKRQLDIADRLDGKCCLAVHYHSFRDEGFRERFYDVIEYARRELDPEFVTVDRLFES